MAVSGEPIDFAEELVASGTQLGDRLVARSSTLLEASGEWSGAFTSYVDIAPADLPKAVVGCWSSAFSVAALDRQEAAGVAPGSFPMSVLVQPALEPVAGGWAEIADDGTVTVHGVKGTPAPLLQGWVTGLEGDELIELIGHDRLDSIQDVLAMVHAAVGANRCEWALTDRVWILQVANTPREPRDHTVALGADVPDELVEIVKTVVLAPGPLGEEIVLPWAIAALPDVDLSGNELPSIEEVRRISRELTEQVWGLPWAQAHSASRRMLASLAGGQPDLQTLRGLRPSDPEKASRLLAGLRALRAEIAERGVVSDAEDAWHLELASIEKALAGQPVGVAHRLGTRRWEPLVASVVFANVAPTKGTPAAPGVGAGRRVDVSDPHRQRPQRRGVITAAQPIPALASHLWDGAGVVTNSGSPAAHLFESARALRVPAVCGVDLGEPKHQIVAVDGDTGMVGTLTLDREI